MCQTSVVVIYRHRVVFNEDFYHRRFRNVLCGILLHPSFSHPIDAALYGCGYGILHTGGGNFLPLRYTYARDFVPHPSCMNRAFLLLIMRFRGTQNIQVRPPPYVGHRNWGRRSFFT